MVEDKPKDILVEVRMLVAPTKELSGISLATGVEKIIKRRWPKCDVELVEVAVVSLSTLFKKKE